MSEVRPSSRRAMRRWRIAAVLLVVCFTAFALTARHGRGSWDYYTANYASWHLVHTGSPVLGPDDIPWLRGNPESGTWIKQTDKGEVITRFPGVIAIALPAYFVAQAEEMTVVPGALTAAACAALALLLMFLALRTRLSERMSAAAVLVLGFATPVWTVSADAVWPHTVTMLGIAGMAWGSATRRWWVVGLFGGVALWGRLHAAVIVALMGVMAGAHHRKPRITLVIASVSLTSLLLLCAWTRWMYGTWSPTGSYNDNVFDVAPRGVDMITNQLGMWIAPDRGILIWTPILLLLTPALVRAWRELPEWSRTLMIGGLVYTVLQAYLNTFTGGDNFYGYRLGLEFLVCATPALAFSAPYAGRTARLLLPTVIAVQVAAFAIGSVFEVAFLPEETVWRDNGFLFAMRELWPVGPLAVLVALIVALLAQGRVGTLLDDRPSSDSDPRSQSSDTQARTRGTASSHSVP